MKGYDDDIFDLADSIGIDLETMSKTNTIKYYSKCFAIFNRQKFDRFYKFFYLSKSISIYKGLSLGISYRPRINLWTCIDIGFSRDPNDLDNTHLYISTSGISDVDVSLDVGLYIPNTKSRVRYSINFGLEGKLGYGTIGMKLGLFFIGKKKAAMVYIFILISNLLVLVFM